MLRVCFLLMVGNLRSCKRAASKFDQKAFEDMACIYNVSDSERKLFKICHVRITSIDM